MKQHIN